MPLTPIAPDLWGTEHDHFMGLLHFRVRMTVLRLPTGLWLHSPVPIDDALAAEIDALGPVRWIVAPNGYHHCYVAAAAERWPEAEVHVSPAVFAKRPELAGAHRLDAPPPEAWQGLQVLAIDGVPKLGEFVFFHEASQSLVVTDLITWIQVAHGWFSRLFFRLEGLWNRPAHSLLWRLLTKDKVAFAHSLRAVLALPTARIVVSHGAVIEDDCPATLARVLRKPLAAGGLSALPRETS